jgi:hypothetical protein
VRTRLIAALGVGLAATLALLLAGAVASPSYAGRTPKLPATQEFVISDPAIDEASGMAASRLHPGVVFIVEDSGNGPYVYAVGRDGRTLATFTLDGAKNVDWEAMAPSVDAEGRPTLLIGDIGDNDGKRDSVRVYEILEPAVLQDAALRWRKWDLRYPDGAHDAEGLMVDPSTLQAFVVTKQVLGAGTYAVPLGAQPGGTYEMSCVGGAPMFVTDAAISPDGDPTVLRTYATAVVVDGPGGPEVARYLLPVMPQGETLAFTADGTALLVGSEGSNQSVDRVEVPVVAPLSASPATTEAPSSTRSSGAPLAAGAVAVVALGLVVGAAVASRRRSSSCGEPPQQPQDSRSTT